MTYTATNGHKMVATSTHIDEARTMLVEELTRDGALSPGDAPHFEHALVTAYHLLPCQRRLTKNPSGYTIVRKDSGSFAVYDTNAWTEPSEQPMLPWSPPTGTKVVQLLP